MECGTFQKQTFFWLSSTLKARPLQSRNSSKLKLFLFDCTAGLNKGHLFSYCQLWGILRQSTLNHPVWFILFEMQYFKQLLKLTPRLYGHFFICTWQMRVGLQRMTRPLCIRGRCQQEKCRMHCFSKAAYRKWNSLREVGNNDFRSPEEGIKEVLSAQKCSDLLAKCGHPHLCSIFSPKWKYLAS